MGILDEPRYTVATAARLAAMTPTRVRRWLHGYSYTYRTGADKRTAAGSQGPVAERGQMSDSRFVSFLDLLDLFFVKRFLDHGLSLQRVRQALEEAKVLLGGHHFAQRAYFNTGKSVFVRIKGKDGADALLELLTGGQWVISDFVLALARRVQFQKETGLAQRWFPLGIEAHLVVDPVRAFGQPIVASSGMTTANVYDLFLAEGRSLRQVARWTSLDVDEIKQAVRFEEALLRGEHLEAA